MKKNKDFFYSVFIFNFNFIEFCRCYFEDIYHARKEAMEYSGNVNEQT